MAAAAVMLVVATARFASARRDGDLASRTAAFAGSGTWTTATSPPAPVSNCLLLTDGTVMCQRVLTNQWYKLTPDARGSYASGTWSALAPMQSGYAPLYYASAVLPDGRVIVEGGEYNCDPVCTSVWQTQGAIYDPASNAWTAVSPPSGWTTIGDAMGIVLGDGTYFLSDCCSKRTAKFNPASLTWTPFGTGFQGTTNDEAGWVLLPDNSLVTVDVTPAGTSASERFDPTTGVWSSAGHTPVSLADNADGSRSFEIGPGALRPDGTVFVVGANPNIGTPCCAGSAHTAILDTATGNWAAGPDLPNSDGGNDAPAAVLPTGNVLIQAAPPASAANVFGTPSRFYEFDGSTITQVASPPNCAPTCDYPSFAGGMLVLPTGQVLLTVQSGVVQLYTPTGGSPAAWAPTIANAPASVVPGGTYTISGTQFNGLTQGAYYGDDLQAATNYPLVRFTNRATAHVFYARTHDHSSMGVATGHAIVSTSFDVPADIETGASDLEVVVNGIPSTASVVQVGSTGPISVAVQTNPSGRTFMVDGTPYSSAHTFSWTAGASHTIATTALQSGGAGTRYAWSSWSDGGTISHTVTPGASTAYTANFTTKYQLTMSAGTGGTVTPATGYYTGGQTVQISAAPAAGYSFSGWTGTGVTSYTGTDNQATVTMNGPIAEVAAFTPTISVTVQTSPSGRTFTVDGTSYASAQTFWWIAGASHTVGTASPQSGTTGTEYAWSAWSDGGAISHAVSPIVATTYTATFTTHLSVPRVVAGDFDGDARSDLTVFRPATGAWYSALSGGSATATAWGAIGDVDVAADYDGDGRTDIAVFRPSTGAWFILQSGTGMVRVDSWGTSGDIPLAGDVDGDGKADLVVFRPGTGAWWIKRSTGGSSSFAWGSSGDQPLVGDVDGDGKADLIIFRAGAWYVLESGGASKVGLWGTSGDIPVPGDFDGDGRTDLAVFRPGTGTWWVLQSSGGTLSAGFGTGGDIPLAGDQDGDGKADFLIFRNGAWYSMFSGGGSAAVGFGTAGDEPIGRSPGP